MNQITTNPSLDTPPVDIPRHPSDILMTLVIDLLAPMFLAASAGDPSLARLAAIETVNAYRLRHQADLIAAAQIIAFGLAALASLSRSMAQDISLPMTLRLRGNANALNRSAEQNRRALGQSQALRPLPQDNDPTAVPHDAAATRQPPARTEAGVRTADPLPPPVSAMLPANPAAEKRHNAMWAIAMVQEAGEIAAALPSLPPAERRAASIRAAALSSTANELLTGKTTPLSDAARPTPEPASA